MTVYVSYNFKISQKIDHNFFAEDIMIYLGISLRMFKHYISFAWQMAAPIILISNYAILLTDFFLDAPKKLKSKCVIFSSYNIK